MAKMHWQIPAMMLTALFVGIALSVGHHLFYDSLDGKVVESVSQQTWNFRIGTGIAFVVKVALSAAVGIACVQNVWLVLNRKSVPLGTIDGLFGILGKPVAIVNLGIWKEAPLVIGLAVVAWCLPLAAIVTPASLTVELSRAPSVSSLPLKIPSIDWYNSSDMYDTGGALGYFNGARSDITRLALVSGTSASIIPISSPPAPNASYALEFEAPSLKCRDANETVQSQVREMWGPLIFFNSWVGSSNLTDSFRDSANRCSGTCITSAIDSSSKDQMKLYVAVGTKFTILECGLYNSSFVADFEYVNGAQRVSVRNETILNPHPYRSAQPENPWTDPISSRLYQQSYSYQAIMQAFGKLLVGSGAVGASGNLGTFETQVLFTPLVNTEEFKSNQQSGLDGSLRSLGGAGRNFSLQEGVEEMFRNLTFSIFSVSQYLQPLNETKSVNVDIFSPQNVYQYHPRNLLLAYGIAILFAVLGVLLGITAMWVNGAAFENDFSTVLRVSRHPELLDIVLPEETTGAQPLPNRLKKMSLGLVRVEGVKGGVYQSLALGSGSGKERGGSDDHLKG